MKFSNLVFFSPNLGFLDLEFMLYSLVLAFVVS